MHKSVDWTIDSAHLIDMNLSYLWGCDRSVHLSFLNPANKRLREMIKSTKIWSVAHDAKRNLCICVFFSMDPIKSILWALFIYIILYIGSPINSNKWAEYINLSMIGHGIKACWLLSLFLSPTCILKIQFYGHACQNWAAVFKTDCEISIYDWNCWNLAIFGQRTKCV